MITDPRFTVRHGDITREFVDAIVDAANTSLLGGGAALAIRIFRGSALSAAYRCRAVCDTIQET